MDFPDLSELYAFIYQGSTVEDWVYTGDGLMVGFGRVPERHQIDVTIHQLLVDGRKPTGLCGARSERVRLDGAKGRDPQAVFAVARRRFGLEALQQRMPGRTCEDILSVRLPDAS
jgi:hypothetical protein